MKRHPRTTPATTALAVTLLLLTACGGQVDDVPDADAPPAPDEAPTDDGSSDGSDPLLGPEIQIALDDVTERADVPRDEVQIQVTELVTWPDGALGCPQPDEMYTQALVDGFRIVLEADGETYAYHGATGDDPQYCADPQPPVE